MRYLKQGGAYFRVRVIIHMKVLNFVIFSFQVTINKYNYYVFSIFSLVIHLFLMHFGLVTVRLLLDF